LEVAGAVAAQTIMTGWSRPAVALEQTQPD